MSREPPSPAWLTHTQMSRRRRRPPPSGGSYFAQLRRHLELIDRLTESARALARFSPGKVSEKDEEDVEGRASLIASEGTPSTYGSTQSEESAGDSEEEEEERDDVEGSTDSGDDEVLEAQKPQMPRLRYMDRDSAAPKPGHLWCKRCGRFHPASAFAPNAVDPEICLVPSTASGGGRGAATSIAEQWHWCCVCKQARPAADFRSAMAETDAKRRVCKNHPGQGREHSDAESLDDDIIWCDDCFANVEQPHACSARTPRRVVAPRRTTTTNGRDSDDDCKRRRCVVSDSD